MLRIILLSIVYATTITIKPTNNDALCPVVTPGERSADHPATDRVEAVQLHFLSVLLSGEQWHLSASSPCDNRKKKWTDLILGSRTRTPSSSPGRSAARFRMEPTHRCSTHR